MAHNLGCGEIALMLHVLGDGQSVRCDYVRALFKDERLPLGEGWAKREYWRPVGVMEVVLTTHKVKTMIGSTHCTDKNVAV